eukprot:gene6487-1156_t
MARTSEAAVPEDRIASLPGFDGYLPPQYSGYVPVSDGHLHYWLSESEGDSSSDPLVLWLNGGPGSSSLIGLLEENGPITVNVNSKDTRGHLPKAWHFPIAIAIGMHSLTDCSSSLTIASTVLTNPYGWTQFASMLYLESPKVALLHACMPAPGLAMIAKVPGHGPRTSACVPSMSSLQLALQSAAPGVACPSRSNTDESTAVDAHEFLVNWSTPTGPGVFCVRLAAQVYVPMLIDQIDKNGVIGNFRGAAIGNGCAGSAKFCTGPLPIRDQIDFNLYRGHDMISRTLEDTIVKECGDFPLNSTPACATALGQMRKQVGPYYTYNIYDECRNYDISLPTVLDRLEQTESEIVQPKDSFYPHPQLRDIGNYPCGTDHVSWKWLNKPEVECIPATVSATPCRIPNPQPPPVPPVLATADMLTQVLAAIHVNVTSTGMNYSQTVGDLRPLYKELFQKHRMMIYSGDVDGCVPYFGSEAWTRGMGFEVVKDWHPWMANTTQQEACSRIIREECIFVNMSVSVCVPLGAVVAGYAIKYEHLDFVTVKGAGHMVPQYKPARALEMFR